MNSNLNNVVDIDNDKNAYLYVYRYMFRIKDVNGTQCTIHTGTMSQHEEYLKHLINSIPNIESCVREYMHHFDVSLFFNIDTIDLNNYKEDNNNEEV